MRPGWFSAFRQSADRHLEGRIGAQRVAVVAVRIAAGDQQGTEADHLGVAVLDALRRPVVAQAARQPLADPKPPVDLAQQQDATVRGQPAPIKSGNHRFAGKG